MTENNASLTPPSPDDEVTIRPPRSNGSRNALADQPWRGAWRDVLGGSVVRSVVAIVLAMFVGMLIAVFTDEEVQGTLGYFFSQPGDFFRISTDLIGDAVRAMVNGAVYSPSRGFAPLLTTLQWTTPLIAAGLGLGVAFRAGLFNIGGQGQILAGAFFASYVGANWSLPIGLHLILALFAAIVGAAIWAGIVGFLKAQTGAHEVILTIMFNWIAFWGITYLLKQAPFQSPNAPGFAKSKAIEATAVMPSIGGLGLGFAIVILAAVLYWWLMDRSTVGFQIRAVGINPHAARTAGINVKSVTIITMALSGAFVGIAAATQTLEVHTSGIEPTVHAGIGFDAITVALLGGNNPVGIVFAALLFGALKAGSVTMEIQAGVPRDLIPVIQGLIVLFVAAPRFLGFLPRPTGVKLGARLAARKGDAK